MRKLRETGWEVEADGLYELNDDRIDAADVVAVEVGERASILEYDGGLPRDESEQKAWAARAVETMRLGKRWRFGSTFIGTGLLQPHKRVVGGGGVDFRGGGGPPARSPLTGISTSTVQGRFPGPKCYLEEGVPKNLAGFLKKRRRRLRHN